MDSIFDNDNIASLEKYSGAEIFLIDDEQIVIDTLTYFLESSGFKNIHGFSDSESAIEQMQFVRPDVIFTDICMPGFDGNKLAKKVRSFPHMYTVPIIAITADHSFAASRSMIKDGAGTVLLKPVSREVLVQRTVEAIDNKLEQIQVPKEVPDVEYFSGSSETEPTLPGLSVPEETALDRRKRRQNSFRE